MVLLKSYQGHGEGTRKSSYIRIIEEQECAALCERDSFHVISSILTISLELI